MKPNNENSEYDQWDYSQAKAQYGSTYHVPEATDKIYFEDCITGMHKLEDSCVDLIIADPPFGIGFNGKGSQYNRDKTLVIDNYEEINENYDNFTMRWISELPRLMKPCASAYIFSGWTHLKDVLSVLKNCNLEVINHIIWKYQFGVFTKKKFVTSHYHILFAVKNPDIYYFNKIEHYPLDVWDIPREYRRGKEKNGTKLPEAVVQRIIDFSSEPGALVLDPFLGNGTTAVCAKNSFRHYLGYEKNQKMLPIITQNLDDVELGSYFEEVIDS